MSEWKECTLRELLVLHDKKRIPLSSIEREKRKGPYPYYGATCIFGYVDDYLFDGDYILLGEDGTVVTPEGKPVLQRVSGKIWVNNHAHVITGSDSVDFRFLYYLLSNTDVSSIVTGAVQPKISQGNLLTVRVSIPSPPTQRKIAAVLGALDDKIELNRKMNANLEAMAQALFKSWFVDFEPFGGQMPEGWRMGKLSELIAVCYGKDHKKLSDGTVPVYGSGGIMRYAEKPIFESESVLIPRKGTLNNIMYVDRPFWTVDTMFYSKMMRPNVAKYVYLFLRRKDMGCLNAGSAVPSMTTEILNDMDVAIPSDDCLAKFEGFVSALFRKKFANRDQNRTLAQLRDTLLPKLMSGELDVDEVKVEI